MIPPFPKYTENLRTAKNRWEDGDSDGGKRDETKGVNDEEDEQTSEDHRVCPPCCLPLFLPISLPPALLRFLLTAACFSPSSAVISHPTLSSSLSLSSLLFPQLSLALVMLLSRVPALSLSLSRSGFTEMLRIKRILIPNMSVRVELVITNTDN